MDILFFIGIAIILGFIGGKISNRFSFPGVVGYLLTGLIIGPSIFSIFNMGMLEKMEIFSDMALGVVAFIIGSEMRMDVLRKMGKGIITIIFSESFGAFILVTLGVYFLTHKLYIALIFGAMAPASAPAGTAVVLQEYKARGPLTNALYAVVGLDDGLAIIIYAFAAALAKLLLIGESISFLEIVKGPLIDIIGAIIIGGAIGFTLGYFMRRLRSRNEVLAVSLGVILVCTGLSKYLHISLILSNLSLGITFTNFFPLASRRSYETMQFVTLPIYIIFFVIAGAHLQLSLLPAIGFLGLVYIIGRILGLVGGAFFGAVISRQEPVIRKYLGLGILSQAGVAIGLAILATKDFGKLGNPGQDVALLVINTIAATTIIFEILGPITTKIAISKAGEIGKAQ